MAEKLRIGFGEYVPPINPLPRPEPPKPEPVARWRTNPDKLLSMYRNHSRRYELWTQYKPLSRAAVDRWDLGVGRLPFQRDNGAWYLSRSDWLTVPLWDDGQLVAIRGRNMGSTGPKWLSSRGSQYALAFVDNVQADSVCWVVENVVDAIWLMDAKPEWSAVSTNGSTTWRRDWATRLAAQRPALVVVSLDKDLPGNGGGNHRDELIAEWKAEHPGAAIPRANGPLIANDLRRAGVDARLFEWPDDAPVKAGVDWALGN
ncbi:MAG: hypothetical protein KF753_05150 [Caldilineaceae bacterium]|nr:hypothetical protein [Caldilineaceae bacterium]